MKDIVFSLWFLLPIGFANMAPIFLMEIPLLKQWNFPVDFYRMYRGKRILGDHKTIRGLLGGIVVAILVVLVQQYIYEQSTFVRIFSRINYISVNVLLLGFLVGFGALGGDSLKSFFKRQIGIAPGKSFFPFDQLDYIIGAIVLTSCIIRLPFLVYVYLLVEGFVLHLGVSYVGYILRFKKTPI